MENKSVLEMKSITKRFPGVLALDKVSLELRRGEIHALIGENGAGKSTLMKILSGAYKADEGDIILNDSPLLNNTPRYAMECGISIIYQELNYVKDLTVAENIYLGAWPKTKIGTVSYKKLIEDTNALLAEIGLNIKPKMQMDRLSVAEKQLVEIVKSISKNAKIFVMDEPTSALNENEINILFDIVKRLAKEGKSIIYISHRLDEVFRISDRVSVMRDGAMVGTVNTKDTDKFELIRMMVGREIKNMYPIERSEKGENVFEVENLSGTKANDVSFCVRKGEIVGLFGLMGAGRTDIAETIFGSAKKESGTIRVNGKVVSIKNPHDAIRAGLGYVPSERKRDGLILIHSVKENISIASLKRIAHFFVLNLKKERELASQWVSKLDIKTPRLETIADSLSGGNQQKVVLGRWIARTPTVLIMNEPTRGVDVGAKVEIYKLMEEFCKLGLGIVMISSELLEILSISDRVITIYEGKISGEFEGDNITQEKLLIAAMGEEPNG